MNNSQWFSSNPDKAWAEKLFLWFIPVFFAYNALMQQTGWLDAGTFWHIVQNALMWLPYCVLLPLMLRRNSGIPWQQSYWFKANVFMFWWIFIATYFHTEYFFEMLGLRYRFEDVHWYFDSALVGPDESSALQAYQKVPLGMYLNSVAFFIVFHNSAVIFMRRVRGFTAHWGETARRLSWGFIVGVTALFWAWAETYMYITDDAAGNVWYENLDQMLLYGSAFYALYFVVSFPMYYRLDESSERWSLSRVFIEASAVGLLSMLLIDLASHLIEPLA